MWDKLSWWFRPFVNGRLGAFLLDLSQLYVGKSCSLLRSICLWIYMFFRLWFRKSLLCKYEWIDDNIFDASRSNPSQITRSQAQEMALEEFTGWCWMTRDLLVASLVQWETTWNSMRLFTCTYVIKVLSTLHFHSILGITSDCHLEQ